MHNVKSDVGHFAIIVTNNVANSYFEGQKKEENISLMTSVVQIYIICKKNEKKTCFSIMFEKNIRFE
ncbi:hypothetical protein T4D_12382 [Trichinella pseudospiralis]|uniref:Uncharacterized protein n=1 Tax=Trichinella pseudospiralis TaxID=6337 RepID=A0A0V1FP85_TRIPS|nr:hypothetical protein T4D_12382 [Trichinella pseudospiralis]